MQHPIPMMAAPLFSDATQGSHHNRDFTLQKYLLLQEQHDFIRQHLDELRRVQFPDALDRATANTSPLGSPRSAYSASPSPYSSRSPSLSRGRGQARRPSLSVASRPDSGLGAACLETVLDESTLQELATEEARLFDVNEGIKRALTELLNCDAIRNDRSFRTWVQCRLMDTEKELRLGRRRRSS